MNVRQLRDFLSGGSPVLDTGARVTGYLDGKVLGDPFWYQRRSEVAHGRFVVRSWRGKTLGEFPMADISSVVSLRVFLGVCSTRGAR